MTEAQWLACGNPEVMLKLLRDKASERKLLLFACACRRRIPHYQWEEGNGWLETEKDGQSQSDDEYSAQQYAALFLDQRRMRKPFAVLLRDVVGNPFRPVSLNRAWLTPTVVSLAQAAHDERILPSGLLDPARLAVLSDALEEAGCTDAAIVSHLRSAGPHVRGCWALDLILGKQ